MLRRSAGLTAMHACVCLTLAGPARAHNESVHQQMTDYAYHTMLAAQALTTGGPMSKRLRESLQGLASSDTELATFLDDATGAVGALRSMPAGLPLDASKCIMPFPGALLADGTPDWMLPTGVTLDQLPMGQVRLPVTIHYAAGVSLCDIDIDRFYEPSGVLKTVNPGGFNERDYTGVTLGYWAAEPDKQTHDWVLRSTTLETLQNPAVLATIAAGTSVAVTTVCLLACGFFPPACVACAVLGVGAGGAVVDEITSIDADSLESEDFVGFGHFIDMKALPATPAPFDVQPGKLIERAGPSGVPDGTEELVAILFDLAGMHVNHTESQAPKNYEIALGASGAVGTDAHRNSVLRSVGEWEAPELPQLQLTPVDNLGLFGYETAKASAGTPLQTQRLGWPLHAIADAAVPMHAVGASGFGHRPYEDSVEMRYAELLDANSLDASVDEVLEVVRRAVLWRRFIQNWRSVNASSEVPVRDLVTEVAKLARQKAAATPAVFKPLQSLLYIIDEDAATAGYQDSTMAAIQRDLLLEGIAAELAFLMSVTEVLP